MRTTKIAMKKKKKKKEAEHMIFGKNNLELLVRLFARFQIG